MKRIFAFFISVCCLFSLVACQGSGGQNSAVKGGHDLEFYDSFFEYRYDFYDSVDSIFEDMDSYTNMNIPTVDQTDYTDYTVSLSKSDVDEFLDYINRLDTKYSYSSYYKLEEALEKYKNITGRDQIKHENLLEELTVDSLVETVKKNNAAYKEQKSKEYTAVFYEEFSDKDLEKYCSIVMNAVNFYISAGKVEDLEEVKCILGDLKVFNLVTTMSNASVADDNCLLINPGMVESMAIKTLDDENQDLNISIIAHEAMHILQKGCTHNNEIVYNIANSYKFEDMDIHPLYNNWFYEGAAEKLMLNCTGYTPITYEYYINYINSLSLSVILNKENSVFDVEETTFKNSLDSLYDVFGCSSDKAKTELLNMLFSLEIIETDDPEFKNAYDADMTEDEMIDIKRALKGEICETMAKYFYKSLARFVFENKVPLNDVFYYITVFEHDVNSHIDLLNPEKIEKASLFVKNYTDIQDKFFVLLAESCGISADKVSDMFNTYGLVNADGNKNFSFSCLTAEKQKLFSYILNCTFESAFRNIRGLYK